MYARVATFDGVEPDQIDQAVERMGQETGPPPGVPGKRFMTLADKNNRKTMAIGFFETEEDLHTGDAALNKMDPPTTGMGRRTSGGRGRRPFLLVPCQATFALSTT